MLVGLREPLLNDWNHKQFCWFSYHTSNFKKPYDEGRVKVKWLSGYGFLIEHHKKPSHRRLLFSAVAAKLSSNFQQTTKPIFYRGDSHRNNKTRDSRNRFCNNVPATFENGTDASLYKLAHTSHHMQGVRCLPTSSKSQSQYYFTEEIHIENTRFTKQILQSCSSDIRKWHGRLVT
jgi:hypothetical protein